MNHSDDLLTIKIERKNRIIYYHCSSNSLFSTLQKEVESITKIPLYDIRYYKKMTQEEIQIKQEELNHQQKIYEKLMRNTDEKHHKKTKLKKNKLKTKKSQENLPYQGISKPSILAQPHIINGNKTIKELGFKDGDTLIYITKLKESNQWETIPVYL